MSRQDPERDKVTGRPIRKTAAGPESLPLSSDATGRFPIRIARDGTWFYRNSPIQRKELAKLFSTILRLEDDGCYWLKTPVEQGIIDVEDAPFTAVELVVSGTDLDMVLKFRNNFAWLDGEKLLEPVRQNFD